MIFKWILIFYLISFVSLENCEGVKPENATECFSKTTSDSYCCYAISPGYIPFEKQCVRIPKAEYTQQREYWDDYGERWRLECDYEHINYKIEKFKPCGVKYPVNPVDCWSYSTEGNSCCFTNESIPVYYPYLKDTKNYKNVNASNFTTSCFWYKKTQKNCTNDDDNNIISGLTYQCQDTFGAVSLLSFLFFLSFIL